VRSTPGLPWWRVVAKSGRLAPGSEARQAELLRGEGVAIVNGRVKMGDTKQGSGEDA
jgi:alkylated DNA nucleotide flippase Atl1